MADKRKARPAGGIGLDTVKRWFDENKKANPQGWMDAIIEILRSQPPKGFYGHERMTFEDQQRQSRRKWVLANFGDI